MNSHTESQSLIPVLDGSSNGHALVTRAALPGPPAGLLPPDPDGQENSLTLGSLLAAQRRWWRVTVPTGLILSALAGAAVWYQFVPTYRAEAWLRIEAHVPHLAFPQERQYGATPAVATQLELIHSPLVLQQVVRRPELANLPQFSDPSLGAQALDKKLVIEPVGMSELFRVAYESPDAELSARVVNAVLDTYTDFQTQVTGNRNDRIIELLDQERDRRAAELDERRDELKQMASDLGQDLIVSVDNRDLKLGGGSQAALRERLTTVEVEQELLKAQLRAAQEIAAQGDVDVPAQMVEETLDEHPQLKRVEELLADKRSQRMSAELVAVDHANDPVLARLQREIEQHERYLENLRSQLRPKVLSEVEQAQLERQQLEIKQLETRIEASEMLASHLREQLGGGPGPSETDEDDPGSAALDLEFARVDLAQAESVFERISARAEALRTESKAPSQVSVLHRAEPPRRPVQEVPTMKLAGACLAGFGIPFMLALVWERLARRIAEADQIVSDVRLSVLGEVAAMPQRKLLASERGGRLNRSLSRFQESIEYVRTNLLVADHLNEVQVLLVASAVAQEGKTSLASNLALSLSRVSQGRVLLIDSDLRSPDLHTLFEVPLGPGLAEVLEGQAELADALVTHWSRQLHFLPAGHLRVSPHLLLSTRAWPDLIAKLRTEYQYIVVDAPPVLPVSDSLLLAKSVDAALISVLRNVSRSPQVRLATQRLAGGGVRVLGAVLSGVPSGGYHYGYGPTQPALTN